MNNSPAHLLGTIDHLRGRISALEDALQQNQQPHHLPSPSVTPSPNLNYNYDQTQGRPLHPAPATVPAPRPAVVSMPSTQGMETDNIYVAALNLAKGALASGAEEYIGQGTIVCAMSKVLFLPFFLSSQMP